MKVTPLYDRLLVRPMEPSRTTAGGLIIPDLALENTPTRFAEVVAAGHGRLNAQGETVPMIVKVGDVITFYRVQNNEQFDVPSLDGTSERLTMIREAHVTAIITELPRETSLFSESGGALVLPS